MKFQHLFRFAMPLFLLTTISFALPIRANEIATANPSKVLAEMQETKDLNKKQAAEQQKLGEEEQSRVAEVQKLKKDRDSFVQRGTPEWEEKSQAILKKSVELQTWAELTKATLARKHKEELKGLFDKILGAIKEVSAQKKIDLVVADFAVEIPVDLDTLTPEQLHGLIRQQNILFAGKGVDISSDVIVLLDSKYKSGK